MRTQGRPVKKHNTFLISLNVLFAASLACSLGAGASTVPPASSTEPSSQPAADSPVIVPTRNSQVLGDLGLISFTLDTARQVSQTFDYLSGGDIVLTTADANGYGWMLSIPADALVKSETITMTPFATMDVSQSGAKIISGVQLEPDGLQFVDAVRLSVTAPIDNPGISLIFSMNQDGSEVKFAPTTNTSGGKTAIAEIWHFSSAGTDNSSHSGEDVMEVYRKWAAEDFKMALDAAKQFIKNPPRPPEAPQISMFCRGTEVNPDQNEAYEYMRDFEDPYDEIGSVVLGAQKAMELTGVATEADSTRAVNVLVEILKIEKNNVLVFGKQYAKDKPPDRLVTLIPTALQVEYKIQLLGLGEGTGPSLLPYITGWAETIRDYYLNELKTKHDYRAWPGVFTLEHDAQILGGTDRLQELIDTMTFEVILDTSFDGTWYSSGKQYATGNVVQTADVRGLKLKTSGIDLWGDLDNLRLKVKTGTFTNPTGAHPVPSPYTGTMWLKNWDACVTKSFDVVLSGFSGIEDLEGRNAAGAASRAGLKQYWWDAGFFMFTVPIKNLDANMGDQTFTGSGSAGDGAFTGSGKLHIVLKHTPK